MTNLPENVRIVEVGPRDGLQNEPAHVSTADKLRFVERLVGAGLRLIEVTSFVSPRAIPQMADASELVQSLPVHDDVEYCVLVPNVRGLSDALEAGIARKRGRVALFTAASETFAQHNINASVKQSLSIYATVVEDALAAGLTVRGYVSTCFVCPYEGNVSPDAVIRVVRELLSMGVDEVVISDTIGAAAPRDVQALMDRVTKRVPIEKIALHFHDTYGTALANVYAGLLCGVTTFDASAGGLGGCPFAPGAAGNLATEDLVYMLERMGIDTGVDLNRLAGASIWMGDVLNTELASRQVRRLRAANRV